MKRLAGRWLLASASIALAVGLFEVAGLAGLVDYRTLFQARSAPWERTGNRPDPDLLYTRDGHQRLRPTLTGNDVARLSGGPSPTLYHCDFRCDRDGFRNSIDLNAADVVVLGDSLIEGFHVDEREILTARLAQQSGLVVANLARGGDGPQQELQVLRRYGLRLRPKVCVWAFYEGNDLADAADYDRYRRIVEHSPRVSRLRRAVERSFTANAVDLLNRTVIRPAPLVPARLFTGRWQDRPGGPVEIAFGSGDYRVDKPRAESREFEIVRSVLAEANAACREHGIDFVVAFIPSKFRVYGDFCTFNPSSPCRGWMLDDLPAALKGTVEGLGADVAYVDLTRRLRDEAAAGSLVYLPDDTHWSSAGHRAAADELAARISALRR